MRIARESGGGAAGRVCAIALVLVLFGCDGHGEGAESQASDAAADAARASAMDAAAQAGAVDSGAPSDAAAADSGGGVRDSGARDSGALQASPPADAATDAAEPASCDIEACPLPSDLPSRFKTWGYVVACCTDDGGCGLLETNPYVGRACIPLSDGVSDPRCLDADVDGTILDGCCRPDGSCGQFDRNVGCHELVTSEWRFSSCDQSAHVPPTTGPFACISEEEPCSYDWECCQDSNYTSICDHSNLEGFGKDVCAPFF